MTKDLGQLAQCLGVYTKDELVQELIGALSRAADLAKALQDILAANEEFRVGMPNGWEGDPLQDACERARAALTAAGAPHER